MRWEGEVFGIYSYNSFLYRKCHLCTCNPINLNIYWFCFLFHHLHYCRLTLLPALTLTSLRAVLWTLNCAQVQNMTCSLALTQERKHSIWCDAINFAIKAQWCVLNCDVSTQKYVTRLWDHSKIEIFWTLAQCCLESRRFVKFSVFTIHSLRLCFFVNFETKDKITELDQKIVLFRSDWEWGWV